MLASDDVGDVILTSKCKLRAGMSIDNGLLVVSNNGWSWRIQAGMNTSMLSKTSKWVRWHDVGKLENKKNKVVFVYVKAREKNGPVKLDGKGNPKLKKWFFVLDKNKDEDKAHYLERRAAFFGILNDIWNANKGDADPPTSDSRI
jgi:hypothetical protein